MARKRRKLTALAPIATPVASAPSNSLLDSAFTLNNEFLDDLKQRQVRDEPQVPLHDTSASYPLALDPVKEQHQELPLQEHQPTEPRNRISLLQLKQVSDRPELVEWHDTNAPDPLFLIRLKTHHGVVQVPATWQGRTAGGSKSSFTNVPYKLPKNIYQTGIAQQRQVDDDPAEAIKQLGKQRVQPKLGTLDLDFGKMRAAFFKHQVRPRLSRYGQTTRAGQDAQPDFSDLKPGVLGQRLRDALGISADALPPWMPQIAKLGPPPPTLPPGYGRPDQVAIEAPIKHWGE